MDPPTTAPGPIAMWTRARAIRIGAGSPPPTWPSTEVAIPARPSLRAQADQAASREPPLLDDMPPTPVKLVPGHARPVQCLTDAGGRAAVLRRALHRGRADRVRDLLLAS